MTAGAVALQRSFLLRLSYSLTTRHGPLASEARAFALPSMLFNYWAAARITHAAILSTLGSVHKRPHPLAKTQLGLSATSCLIA